MSNRHLIFRVHEYSFFWSVETDTWPEIGKNDIKNPDER